jgi:rod shape-determining protein MreD
MVFTAALQLTVCPLLAVGNAFPQLLCILAVFVSLHMRREMAVATSWVLGLMQDLASRGPLGGFAALYALGSFFLSHLRGVVVMEAIPVHFTLCFVFTFFVIASYGLGVMLIYGNPSLITVIATSATVALYTALLTPLAFQVWKALQDKRARTATGRL